MDIQGYVVTSGSKWIKPESDLELVPTPPQQDSRPTVQVQVHWQVKDRSSMRKVRQHDEWVYMDI
jgi:hypothetical protein